MLGLLWDLWGCQASRRSRGATKLAVPSCQGQAGTALPAIQGGMDELHGNPPGWEPPQNPRGVSWELGHPWDSVQGPFCHLGQQEDAL